MAAQQRAKKRELGGSIGSFYKCGAKWGRPEFLEQACDGHRLLFDQLRLFIGQEQNSFVSPRHVELLHEPVHPAFRAGRA